jgi:hypothetical protein
MRERERREGAHAHGERQGARGARAKVGSSWAGLGHIAGQNPAARTTTDRNPIAK